MNKSSLTLAILLGLTPLAAPAQVRLGISIGLPVAPQLEIVAPGVQVVAGFPEEVFLSGGWYWCRRPDGWYRSRDGRGHFDFIEGRRVPRGLMRMPVGQYRNWHREGGRVEGRRGGERMERGRMEERHENRGHEERGHENRGHEEGEHGHH